MPPQSPMVNLLQFAGMHFVHRCLSTTGNHLKQNFSIEIEEIKRKAVRILIEFFGKRLFCPKGTVLRLEESVLDAAPVPGFFEF